MSHLGHHLYGDSLYGMGEEEKEYIERQALHAYKLEFPHPRTGNILKLQCSLPEDIKKLIENNGVKTSGLHSLTKTIKNFYA